MIRKGYTDGPFGQAHWRMAEPEEGGRAAPDLYCFHPAPFSGLAYTGIMPQLAAARRVIAPDYPGYGGSDAFTLTPSINDYAKAMASVIETLSGDAPVDLLGFHTGCLVAAQCAIDDPALVRRLVLIDVPAFDDETSRKLAASNGEPPALTPELSCLSKPWESGVVKRLESQSMARAFEMFVEQLRPGAAMNAAFHAAFSYPWTERLPLVRHETMVLATKSSLLEGSRKAASLTPNAVLKERLDITRAVLDEAADKTAAEVERYLSREKGGEHDG